MSVPTLVSNKRKPRPSHGRKTLMSMPVPHVSPKQSSSMDEEHTNIQKMRHGETKSVFPNLLIVFGSCIVWIYSVLVFACNGALLWWKNRHAVSFRNVGMDTEYNVSIYIVRHGDRVSNDLDAPLTEHGHVQAQHVGSGIWQQMNRRGQVLGGIATSPFQRTVACHGHSKGNLSAIRDGFLAHSTPTY